MPEQILTAVFSTRQQAEIAQGALLEEGFKGRDAVLSIDLTQDPIAAEAPGQAYENQPSASDTHIARSLVDSFTPHRIDQDTAEAKHMADVQSGSVVLTVSGSRGELERAAQLLGALHPVALRSTA